jgi:hypothetical protein
VLGVRGTWATSQAGVELPSRTRGRLLAITGLLGILTVVHDFDHVRQGRGLPVVLYVVAVAALVSIGATLFLIARYATWARTVAVAQGAATVVGVGVVHAAPQRSDLTDSYSAAHVDPLSWLIIVAMMVTGLALTVVAVRADS